MSRRTPTQPPAQPLITQVVDALDQLDLHLQASQVLEQLIEVVKIDSHEDLAHVDRGGLAFLLCLVNVATRQHFDCAKALADAAYDEMRAAAA